MTQTENRWYVKYTYGLAGLILTIYSMIMAKSILLPILFALFLSILIAPISSALEKRGIPRFLSAFIAILAGILVLLLIGFFFYKQMTAFAADADMFTERLQELLSSVESLIASTFSINTELNLDMLVSATVQYVRENASSLTRGISEAASLVTAVFLVPVYMFLILILRDLLINFLEQAFAGGNPERKRKVHRIIQKVKTLVQKYITGVLTVIVILAILYSTMLMIIGLEHAIFFGVFAATLNIIPFIGPLMGSILPILYSIITMDSFIFPLIILGGFYVVQILEGNLFTPLIVGSQVSMNALATLVLLFVGAQIWGLAGMILFIPLGAIFKIICDEVDSLKPYGYLLGSDNTHKTGKKRGLSKKIHDLSQKAKEKAGISDDGILDIGKDED
ncbi:MAG: AI-2E family transporter [Balneolaceae bacterium]|nr:AI-2E family transporter [Balneolaceae bacterium]